MGLRFYISTNQGLRRVATKAIMEEQGVLPQFAGTRQKMVEVITDRRNGQLFFRASGTYVEFDRDGRVCVSRSHLLNAFQLVNAYEAIEGERLKNPNVLNIGLRRKHKELKDRMQWEISGEEREAIIVDLLGKDRPKGTTAIPLLKVEYP